MRIGFFFLIWFIVPVQATTQKGYDFDHQIHFELTKVSQNQYHIKVKPDSYAFFNVQSAFLLRKAAKICGTDKFHLALESGIQEYERFPTEPRAYPGSLNAKITCSNLDTPKE